MFLKIQNLHWVEVACQLFIIPSEVTGHSTTTSLVNLMSLPEEYHNFVDVFSKSKAGKLAEH